MGKFSKMIAIIMVISALLLGGCAQKQPPAQPQQPQQQQAHTMEDPTPIINQMNQVLDDIDAKSKANKLANAKPSANNLVSLNDKLAPNFSDTAFRDNLHHAILALKDEINKPNANQTAVNNQVQSIRGMLKDAPGKMMTM